LHTSRTRIKTLLYTLILRSTYFHFLYISCNSDTDSPFVADTAIRFFYRADTLIERATKYRPILLGSPGEDISRKDLQEIGRRFKNLNLLHKQRIQNFLQPRQRVFLELLPLVFHENHPLLPGFISSETPAGIPDYSPNRVTIEQAKKYSKSFGYKRHALRDYPIQALFLMGSVSSIAFSKTSDMDIWLCHQPGLSAEKLEELTAKAIAVENWAASLALEVHFFLIDSEQFLHGQDTPISSESSGKTQHYLLLEEFYRTAVYIAGRMPVWWFVPPHQEKNYSVYVQHLKQKRFLSEHEIIDFGGLEEVPAKEFISATLWHLYKSIGSPHKSFLKLLLMESYASEYPNTDWLCFELKKAIYNGACDIDALDPYLLIYQKVDNYLQQQAKSSARMTLARQCFYQKIIGAVSGAPASEIKQYRKNFLHNVAQTWNWPPTLLLEFGQRKSWNITKATQEHNIILQQLIQCYRMTMGFARKYVQQEELDNQDSKLIGRKLNSYLERKPGKIEIITARSSVHNKENELSVLEIILASGELGWGLYIGHIKTNDEQQNAPIKKGWSLLEILVWLVINGLYQKKLQLHIESPTLTFTLLEINAILARIKQFLSSCRYGADISLDAYKYRNQLKASLAFINLGITLTDEQESGMHVMSERADALSYGKARKNFIRSIDYVSISTWGEVTIKKNADLEGLFHCLSGLINTGMPPLTDDILSVYCITPIRAKSITLSITSLFSKLVKLYAQDKAQQTVRFFIPGGRTYFVFQNKKNILSYWEIENEALLLEELSEQQEVFSAVFFDHKVLEQTPIPFLYKQNRPSVIQVFYFYQRQATDIYVIDEKGALFRQRHEQATPAQLLTAYSVFLETIMGRGMLDYSIATEYFEIQRAAAGIWSCSSVKLNSTPLWEYLNIRITGQEGGNNRVSYSLYCNEKEFSSMNYGDQVFKMAAEYIFELRRNKIAYPIRITDIDVPPSILGVANPEQMQTIHYLKYKQKIEKRLNG
jgi:adenylate cyclase, class 1